MGRLASSIILLTGWRRALVALFAGAFLTLVQAPFDFFLAGFVSLPVLVWLMDGAAPVAVTGLMARLRPSFAVGWWFGFGYFLAGLWWIGGAVLVEAETYAWALPFAVVGLPLFLAVFYGLATATARLLWSDGIGRIFALAAGFAAAEWLRGVAFTGFPWNAIGYGAMPAPLLMQSVGVVGMDGMNLLAVLLFALPAAFPKKSAIALATILIAAHVGYGAWRMNLPLAPEKSAVQIRVVQPDIKIEERSEQAEATFKTLLDMSVAAPTEGAKKPQIIIWPETSVPFILNRAPNALSAIGEALQDDQVLVAGAVRQEGDDSASARYYNSVVQIDSSGQIVDAVDKNHLVPFGEYIPFEGVLGRLGIRQIVAGLMNYTAGHGRHALQLPGATMLPFVCYEIVFPNLMPSSGLQPDALLNVTNDSWFGATPGPYQHLRQAQVRAVETQKPVVRVANSGISAIIDSNGAIVDALGLGAKGFIDHALQIRPSTQGFRVAPQLVGAVLILLVALAAGLARAAKALAK